MRVVANEAELIKRRIRELDALGPQFDERVRSWTDATAATLFRVLPAGHPTLMRFSKISYTPDVVSDATTTKNWADAFDSGRQRAAAMLSTVLEELTDLEPDEAPAAPGAVFLTAAEIGRLEDVTRRLRVAIDDGQLDELPGDDRRELDAELATLEAQQRSSRPKRSIVKLALTTVNSLIIGVAGGVLGNEVTPIVNDLLQRL